MKTNNPNDTSNNNANATNGRSDKNARTHMKNENGQHPASSLNKSMGNRAKNTGAQTGNKD